MSEAFPEVITNTAQQENLGAYRSTHRPRSAKDRMRLDVFEHGVVAQVGDGGLIPIPWTGMTVYESHISNYGHVSHTYTLFAEDGRSIGISSWPEAERFGPEIQQAVTRAWLPDILNAIAQGQTITFAKKVSRLKDAVALSSDGITIKGRTWPWRQVRKIEIKAGYLSVKVEGKLTPLVAEVLRVGNIHVLINAAEHLRSQTG